MSDVLIRVEENGVGRITLNRPDALHALNEDMCAQILKALNTWSDDPRVYLVLVDHLDGSRGFCAGGDIRMLAESGAGDGSSARQFFATEYRMNAAIHNFQKPYVSILDGVTMGGGVGLSVHGSYRVSTERTLFAMPETGIGLFPDVGGGWFLPRLIGELGTWLALTGARLKGSDVTAAGVGTHHMPSELIANLKSKFLQADFSIDAVGMVDGILNGMKHTVSEGSFTTHMETINSCFKSNRAEYIIAALKDNGGEWALTQIESLSKKSPRTIKVALRQLREGAAFKRFEDNMVNEYRIGARQVQSADFLEGVRAVIIDKDYAPKWAPSRLEDISDETIDAVFAPLDSDEELTF